MEEQKPHQIKLLEDKLAKLKRNLDQMTTEQRVQYKAAIDRIKREIRTDAENIYREYVTDGEIFRHSDEDSKKAIEATKGLLDSAEDIGFKDAAINYLFESYSLDNFLVAITPLFYKCFYEAYGVWYWEKKVELIDGLYYTSAIDMWWNEESQVWEKKDKDGNFCQPFTIMIPPTSKLALEAYEKDMETFTVADSEWRQKIPFIYNEKFSVLFPNFATEQKQISMEDLFK